MEWKYVGANDLGEGDYVLYCDPNDEEAFTHQYDKNSRVMSNFWGTVKIEFLEHLPIEEKQRLFDLAVEAIGDNLA